MRELVITLVVALILIACVSVLIKLFFKRSVKDIIGDWLEAFFS